MKFRDIELPSDRKFGIFFATFFAVCGLYFLTKQSLGPGYISFALSVLLLVVTITMPASLHPLNRLWMLFGFLLGKIVSPIILSCIYFGLFTPISLLMKLFKRDELKLRLSPNKSYWIKSEINQPDKKGFKNQF